MHSDNLNCLASITVLDRPSKATGHIAAALNGAHLTPRRTAVLIGGSSSMSPVRQDLNHHDQGLRHSPVPSVGVTKDHVGRYTAYVQ